MDLPPINWTVADDIPYTMETSHNDIIADVKLAQGELQNVKLWVAKVVGVVDTTNAQLALGGMYVNRSRNQLLAHDKSSKPKDDSHCVKGTYGHIATHKCFLQLQTEWAQQKVTDEEWARLKAEANEQWEVAKEIQLAAEMVWRHEKAQLQTLKQKVPLKPKAVAKKVWIAKNYPELAKEMPSTAEGELEAQDEEQQIAAKGCDIGMSQ